MLVYVPGTYYVYIPFKKIVLQVALEGGVNSNPSSREKLFLRTAYISPFVLALEGGVNSNPSSRERYATLAALGTLPRSMSL